jgi:succinate dehydrogenase / fumarate reductase membrane anchor subunit
MGAAKAGTEHFWTQRMTAVSNLPLTIFFVGIVAALAGSSHASATALLGAPWVAIPLLLLILSVAVHMRIGMQVIIEDYVHSEVPKMLALMANTFFCIAVGLACAFALLKISFGV